MLRSGASKALDVLLKEWKYVCQAFTSIPDVLKQVSWPPFPRLTKLTILVPCTVIALFAIVTFTSQSAMQFQIQMVQAV